MAKRRSKEEWLLLVKDYKESGLSFTDWCKEKQISKSSIYPYIKKYEAQSTEQKWCSVQIPKNRDELSLIELQVGDISLNIKDGFDKETLYNVLDVVMKVC